jgi:DNA topoisomerase-1
LSKVSLDNKAMMEKVEVYDNANRQVAILCNHQKTVSKKQVESLKVKERTIEIIKEYIKDLEKHKSHFSAKKERVDREPSTVKIEGGKEFVKKFPDSKEATVSLIKKTEEKLIREQSTPPL